MIIEPFKPVKFFKFKTQPDIEQYNKILTFLQSCGMLETDPDGITTDYHWNGTPDEHNTLIAQKRLDYWYDYFTKSCGEGIKSMLKTLDKKEMGFKSIWTQITSGATWHHPHDHGSTEDDSNWSFVWYIDVDSKASHKGTIFYSPWNMDDSFEAEVKTGNLYLWPSDIMHMQPPSFNEKERKIISGNLELY